MILVAVPVFGMTTLTVLERTSHTAPEKAFAEQWGAANLVGIGNVAAPHGGWPAGTQVVSGRALEETGLVTANGTARLAKVTDVDLNSPVTRGVALLRSGRFPASAGEALVSPKLAKAFGLHVGDTLKLSEPAWTEHIVGIGAPATNWTDGLLAVRGNELSDPDLRSTLDRVQAFTLVRLPGHPSAAQLAHYPDYFNASSRGPNPPSQRTVNWTLVAGMIALAIAGVVISGAFAVGARRQLVTLGQLSANGAEESLLRRELSLQGAWCGILGTAVGIGAGVVTLTLMHARFSGWLHRDIGPYAWSLRDFLAIGATGVIAATVAAFIPSRSAARVPVLSALAGRRPLGALPRSIVPIGVALFGFGVLLLALVAAAARQGGGDSLAFSAVLGGLLVLSGACCVSPVVVAALAHVGGRLRRAGRVAVRSLVRSRARSAAVVMALAAINSGAIAIGTAFASRTESKQVASAFMPNDTVVLARRNLSLSDGSLSGFLPLEAPTERAVRAILPKATWTERRAVLNTALNKEGSVRGEEQRGKRILALDETDYMTVADPAVLRLVGLAPSDAQALQRVGVLVLARQTGAGGVDQNSATITVNPGASAQTLPAALAKHKTRASAGMTILITPEKAAQLGLSMVPAGEIVTNPGALNESQRASIDAVTPSLMFGGGKDPSPTSTTVTEVLWSGPKSTSISVDTVRNIILAIVVLIALIVLAMSLALSAAETRDERDVLVALGARPSTMRSVAAWKAALLSGTGAVIAIPTGFIPVAVAFLASVQRTDRARLAFPWSTAVALVVIAPLIAAAIAAIGSGIAQRVRPTQMSTFALD
jgi:putative ABC transport system permease protein